MFVRLFGFGVIVLALSVGASAGQDQKSTSSQKDPGIKEIAGKVKDIDLKKKAFVLTLADKTDRTFLVNKDTKFTGPRGAEHEEGLKDDAMAKGSDIRVVPAADEKYAKEVKLPQPKAG